MLYSAQPRKRNDTMNTFCKIGRLLPSVLLTSGITLLTGCATGSDKNDPYECYNRSAFKFNHAFDIVVGRPIADLYDTLIPAPVQIGITRAFYNFYEPSHVANDLLQGEFAYAAKDTARFVVNTTVGIGGFFDVAILMNLYPHAQDLGITFACWGWRDSAYFIVPFFGIYTVRDMIAAPIDQLAFSFYPYIEPESLGWTVYGLDKIHYRAALRPADKVVDEAFDPYVFVRNAYFQKRQQQIRGEDKTMIVEIAPAPVVVENAAQNTPDKSQRQSSKKPTANKHLPDVIS